MSLNMIYLQQAAAQGGSGLSHHNDGSDICRDVVLYDTSAAETAERAEQFPQFARGGAESHHRRRYLRQDKGGEGGLRTDGNRQQRPHPRR